MGVNILMFLHPPRSRRGWRLLSFLPPLTLLTEPSFLKQITAWPLSDRPPVAPMAHKVGNSPQSLQGCAITTPLYVPPCQHKRHTSPPPLYSLTSPELLSQCMNCSQCLSWPFILPVYFLVILKDTAQMTHPPECLLPLSPFYYMPYDNSGIILTVRNMGVCQTHTTMLKSLYFLQPNA